MKRVVIVCNAPPGLKEGLERHRKIFLDKTEPFPHVIAARDPYTIAVKINAAYKPEITKDHDAFAVVFVVNCPSDDLEQLRIDLPGAMFFSIEFNVPNPHSRDYGEVARRLRREIAHAGKLAAALKKEFTERDSRTPLLLPIRNFKSKHLERLLLEVQELRSSGDYTPILNRLIAAGSIRSIRESKKKTFFENANAIRFYGPSKAGARHASPDRSDLPTAKPPHDDRCLVNAYFRLGARYDIKFHYDCNYGTGHIRGTFANCHDGTETFQPRRNINIAPNDHLR